MKNTIVLFALVLSFCATIASAADCRVTKTADTNDGFCSAGDCSLREAVADTSCTMIDFSLDLAGHPISLTQGEIVIRRSLSINGYGSDALTVTGNNISRIFMVATNTTVNINNMTLTGGNGTGAGETQSGGAIYANGEVNLYGVDLNHNSVCANCHGSAVYFAVPSPTGRIFYSTVHDNPSGGSFPAGAVATDGTILAIYDSTLAFNGGPAVYTGGAIRFVNSTVVSNGMGVYVGGLANLMTTNSVLMDIYRAHNFYIFQSEGNNIVRTALNSLPFNYQASDLQNVDPMLGPLSYNGARIQTLAPFAGSPAVDGGSNFRVDFYSIVSDQRGFARIVDGDTNGTATADIGAVEIGAPAPAPVTISGRVVTQGGLPVRGVSVYLTDFQGSETRSSVSSSLGWFTFSGLPAGRVYKIKAGSKRQPTQERNVLGDHDITDADISMPGL